MIRISRNKPKLVDSIETRGKVALFVLYLGLFVITSRLFFWQIIKNESLEAQAENQYRRSITLTGNRGDILTSDGYKLATNNRVYTLFAQPNIIKDDTEDLSKKITPFLLNELDEYNEASESSQKEEIAENFELQIQSKLEKKDIKWVSLKANISEDTKDKIENLNILGLDLMNIWKDITQKHQWQLILPALLEKMKIVMTSATLELKVL